MGVRTNRILAHILLALCGIFFAGNVMADTKPSWGVAPAYETPTAPAATTAFSIKDQTGQPREIYAESYAILIMQGAYRSGGWNAVSDAALPKEKLLREALERRGFHVLVWRDLTSKQLWDTLRDVFGVYGYKQNARLLFYYYGHGQVMGTIDDPSGPRTFLVPVDAPNPFSDEEAFYRSAVPINFIVQSAKDSTVKHALFAFEACQAGSVIKSLVGPMPPNPKGYLLTKEILRPVRQFLTAGAAGKDIPAQGVFTAMFVGGLSDPEADTNHDGYVTGSELMNYVSQRVPQNTREQQPEWGRYPIADGGDIVLGLADPTNTPAAGLAPTPPVPKTVPVPRAAPSEWRLVQYVLPDSPVYARGSSGKIKISTASRYVKGSAIFSALLPRDRSKIEASYNVAEGGLYIPFKIPANAAPGVYEIDVYVEDINTKKQETHSVEFEVN